MKSKAQIKGHPLHPILVNFPLAFFIGTLLFDTLSCVYHAPSFYQTAFYLEVVGLLSACCAAIPGILDYVYTVPPQSTAKSRAAQHGLINSTAVILFTGALCYRLFSKDPASSLLLTLETLGAILLTVAGWMGGTLVVRNQIGVDIRYAGAGKWKEMHVQKKNGKVELGNLEELKSDQMILVHVDKKRIVVARTGKAIVAFDDKCSHRGGSLAAGAMACGLVQCPWHGSQFDVKTGEVKAGPAKTKITPYVIMKSEELYYMHV